MTRAGDSIDLITLIVKFRIALGWFRDVCVAEDDARATNLGTISLAVGV